MKNNDEESFFELKKAASYIRRELSQAINIKKVPFVELHLDDMTKNSSAYSKN